ncbi:hypothetical protein PSPO01_14784 [Paraphaeosphaeria sporulosa]
MFFSLFAPLGSSAFQRTDRLPAVAPATYRSRRNELVSKEASSRVRERAPIWLAAPSHHSIARSLQPSTPSYHHGAMLWPSRAASKAFPYRPAGSDASTMHQSWTLETR